ncbi:MAG: SDR family oxidoreductase [Proteobacteria bacterium]|nr:SDR family oxidoreductase [Pseudomonadota bacterium]
MGLNEKVAIITGAGGGIGKATALRFAKEGAKVVIADIMEEKLAMVSAQIKKAGGQVVSSIMNHTDKTQVIRTVEKALSQFGKIDILCNIAGMNKDSICKKMKEQDFDDVIDINLKGPWLCCQAVIPAMSEQQSGTIINTSSIGAHGNIGQTNYAAAKAGVIALSKSLALELSRYNVTVNTVAPGATDTPLLRLTPQEVLDKFKYSIPLKRFATTAELANVYAFLAGNGSSYITGQVIYVAGGLDLVFK